MTFKELFKEQTTPAVRRPEWISGVAAATGKSYVTVERWLTGERNMPEEMKPVVAAHLGRPVSELFPELQSQSK